MTEAASVSDVMWLVFMMTFTCQATMLNYAYSGRSRFQFS